LITSRFVFLRNKNVSAKVVEKIKRNVLSSNFYSE